MYINQFIVKFLSHIASVVLVSNLQILYMDVNCEEMHNG
jgi:hypothetical protein